MMARELFSRPPDFVASFLDAAKAPDSREPEIAFVGRSNVGKSSLVNALFRARIARSGKTPGRTRALNFFVVPNRLMVVDLPGYGFAKVPPAESAKWRDLMAEYLRVRAQLKRVFVLIDSRVGVKESDFQMFALLDQAAQNYQVVLTKVDKGKFDIPRFDSRPALAGEVLAVSSATGEGLDALRRQIASLATRPGAKK
jgi:GTP-binding protein